MPAANAERRMRLHLLFDLDGTLTDSRPGIVTCLQHAMAHVGRDCPPISELTGFVGPPLAGSFATLLGGDSALIEQAIAAYRERFEREGMFENALYPGIRDALADFTAAGHTLFLVTVKPRVYARRILEHFELAELFDAVYGPELGDRQYTKAALVREACAAARLDAGRTIMIGDRGEDVAAAKESELRAVAVTWGYGARPELEAAQPDTLIDSADELVEYVRSIASDRRARAFEGEDR